MSHRLLKTLAMFCFVAGLATWMGTMPGAAAFALGIGFGVYVVRPVLRWAEQ